MSYKNLTINIPKTKKSDMIALPNEQEDREINMRNIIKKEKRERKNKNLPDSYIGYYGELYTRKKGEDTHRVEYPTHWTCHKCGFLTRNISNARNHYCWIMHHHLSEKTLKKIDIILGDWEHSVPRKNEIKKTLINYYGYQPLNCDEQITVTEGIICKLARILCARKFRRCGYNIMYHKMYGTILTWKDNNRSNYICPLKKCTIVKLPEERQRVFTDGVVNRFDQANSDLSEGIDDLMDMMEFWEVEHDREWEREANKFVSKRSELWNSYGFV